MLFHISMIHSQQERHWMIEKSCHFKQTFALKNSAQAKSPILKLAIWMSTYLGGKLTSPEGISFRRPWILRCCHGLGCGRSQHDVALLDLCFTAGIDEGLRFFIFQNACLESKGEKYGKMEETEFPSQEWLVSSFPFNPELDDLDFRWGKVC